MKTLKASMTKNSQIQNINDLLNQYRERIKQPRDRGTAFEKLIKSYLEHDPFYANRFKKVSMWSEWEYNWGPDCGIDLIAEDRAGEFTAIQCKFYEPEYEIKKDDINSFFAESGRTFKVKAVRKSFSNRILFTTSDIWSINAENTLNDQHIPVSRVHVRELEQSSIDWSKYSLDRPDELTLKAKKTVRPHQGEAITNIIKGFKEHDRGKLIMACGTGKTFTALKLTEKVVKKDGNVLFLVPSISLLSQTLTEWTAESENPFNAFAVCSDSKVGKHEEDISRHDLAIPASTDTKSLLKGIEELTDSKRRTIIFSTYQSIDVISQAQKKGLPEFDLIICDEAHRTTGVTLINKDESHFVKIHDQTFMRGKKRLYMTATPRLFGDAVKTKAKEAGAELCSMDDESKYGPEFHRLGFGKAVSDDLLTDYKVLVLAVDEKIIDPKFQRKFSNNENEIPLEDVAKIIGCWNGLSKKFVGDGAEVEDKKALKRAVAFTRSIKDSMQIANAFQNVTKEYIKKNPAEESVLDCEVHHVDGSFNVLLRNKELAWLKAEVPENQCRILTNARCLSEGVDVPALDAVMFLNSRDSMVDVVQSVGRIMRKAEGKKYGYIILPIAIPTGIPPEEALKQNKKYEVVWKVLQALRAHDDRFNAEINQIDLNKKKGKRISVIGVGGSAGNGSSAGTGGDSTQIELDFPEIESWKDAIFAKIVLKCGNRLYWEQWAADVAKIAETHIKHFKKMLSGSNNKHRKKFDQFLNGIRKNINPSISEDDAIEMLAQQLITKPVFDALFDHYEFTKKNPVSIAMQDILDDLITDEFKNDLKKLESFYFSIKMRVQGINTAEGRQKIITDLYDKFFKVAFPKMSERLGIVYTPIEVVDFIINSVEHVMKEEFGKSLSDKGVHILDPFTGTGTFIVRLLQSGIIRPEDLKRKYESEIHANEIVLLAYYIAAINIEESFHSRTNGEYFPFNGAVLTDTFQLTETNAQDSFDGVLETNDERIKEQKKAKISVIIGNPPYSAQQTSENNNNKNLEYPMVDSKIDTTYGLLTTGKSKKNLFDSYIRSIRWTTDRISDSGIIGMVTSGSYIEANNLDGLRRSLEKEFSKIYCFNLRGDQRTTGVVSKKEGGQIFGVGSRTPISIIILVKNKSKTERCQIFYHDIGDYLTRDDKLAKIKNFSSITNVPWIRVVSNPNADWANQRDLNFSKFLPLINDKNASNGLFSVSTHGVVTNRDAWVYNFDIKSLSKNMSEFIDVYNSEVTRWKNKKHIKNSSVDDFVLADPKKISWTKNLKKDLSNGVFHKFDKNKIIRAQYRPFCKTNLLYDKSFVWSVYKLPQIFPSDSTPNVMFSVIGVVDRKGFSVLVTNRVSDLHFMDTGKAFPLYYYGSDNSLKLNDKDNFAITEYAFGEFKKRYSDLKITKEDIFYYIYGILHSNEYRSKYEQDLKKMLPRIPFVKDFSAYRDAGSNLVKLHLNYESAKPYKLDEEITSNGQPPKDKLYQVIEGGMSFPKNKNIKDKSKITFNHYLTLSGIPLDAYEYVVNGKSAIEWVMDRYRITTDITAKGEGSGNKNDPNEWSDDPRYIVDLLKRIVTVSLETNKIVKNLPPLEIIEMKEEVKE